MEKVLLIDSNALIHRSFHALPSLKTSEGELVNAVYGFFLIFIKNLKNIDADYVVTTFDRPEETFRHKEYEEYKSQRPETPEELISQIPLVKKGLSSFNVPYLDKKGFEADDIIATLAKKWKNDYQIIILTGDRDLLQLVDDQVMVHSPGRGIKKMIKFDKEKVQDKYNVSPTQFVDYKALRGDPSDNIPGVSGIGKKRAARLLNEYDNLDNILNNLDEISDNLSSKLQTDEKEARKSKQLIELKTHLDLDIDLEKAKLNYNKKEVIEFFKQYEFKRLLNKFTNDKQQASLNF